MQRQRLYDVVIVGSGATGGWAAKELTQKGLRVAVLEAGRKLDPLKDFTEHTWPYELPFRGFGNRREMQRTKPIQSRCYACTEYGQQFFHHAARQAFLLDSGASCLGPFGSVGPLDVAHVGLRFQGRNPRRFWGRLADLICRY
jgi:choline dehydrogenase-like flavoprotein